VFDVSGAGDTFLAALVAEYLKTKSLEKAIDFANKCSRIVVQRFGTYSITEEDVRSLR
jgi:sugar/nucleoside kinase (ribokinase family)